MKFFATCARGLEPMLAQELREMGIADVSEGRGGAEFTGDKQTLYRANLWLRTAIRVLQPILTVAVTTADDLYDAVRELDWSRIMTPGHTLAVDANVRDSQITHSKYAALRVKDAICDQFMEKVGKRPSVDVEEPMIGLNLHIYLDEATLSLDSSGMSLHKRGYRPILTKAPINEALGAALVLMTGWRGDSPLVDPLCGSGTLCIEGAWIALSRPPGLTRRRFGFQGWLDFDINMWTQLRDEARRQVKQRPTHLIAGCDERRDAVTFAAQNARAAGVGHALSFAVRRLEDFEPPGDVPGVIVCNPPYGERLGEEKDLVGLYQTLGKTIERCPGWKLFVFTGNANLAREIGRKPVRQVPLFNGRIPCKLLEYHS